MKTPQTATQSKERTAFWTAKAANVRVPVYQVKTGQAGKYTAYCISDRTSGKRVLRKFSDLEKAKAEALRIAVAISRGEMETASVTNDDALTLVRARQNIAPLGLTLDTATEILSAAANLVGVHRIVEACREYAKRNPIAREPKLLSVAIDEYIAKKRDDERSERLLSDLRSRLGRFNAEHPGKLVGEFVTADIQKWLNTLKTTEGKKMAAITKRSFAVRLSSFFDYHRRLGAIAENPVDDVERELVRSTKAIDFWTPDEADRLIAAAPSELVAPLAIGLFSGLRSSEICRLTWGDVNMSEGHVVVAGENTPKTGSRRLAPIPAVLKEWLNGRIGEAAELVWPHRTDTFTKAVTAACKAAGVRRVANGARHSCISYRVALSGDVARVALEAGNSPAVVHKDYKGLVTVTQAKQFFAIAPNQPAKIAS